MVIVNKVLFQMFAIVAMLERCTSVLYPDPVQTYFVPLPEGQLMDLFKVISLRRSGVTERAAGYVMSIISIAIAADGTIVYYDHWEDGYEPSITNGPTQSTTLVWGDGDLSNGIAPGTVNDVLRGGMAIVLENPIAIENRSDSILYFDGRDRIQSSLPIAVTRFAYPEIPGSLMAGAVEVFDTGSWGKYFIAPIGEDTSSLDGNSAVKQTVANSDKPINLVADPFEYVTFFIMAGEDLTEIYLNSQRLNGESGFYKAGDTFSVRIKQGDVVSSSRPIQVDILAADKDDNYELRWYAQVDANKWTDEYISPVAENRGPTQFWFYNPNNYTITIDFNGGNIASGNLTVPALSSRARPCLPVVVATASYLPPDAVNLGMLDTEPAVGFANTRYSGVRFKSRNSDRFYALVQVDADGPATISDWGFPMIPTSMLTSQALVGLGRGCTFDCKQMGNATAVNAAAYGKERSVVWVTPLSDTRIFVDYDGDNVYDSNFALQAFHSLRLTDIKNNDLDMTGAVIVSVNGPPDSGGQPQVAYPPVKIAVAWGQDPPRSVNFDTEGLDLGTAVLPLQNPDIKKNVFAVYNPDGTEDPNKIVDQVGDVISYKIIISNVGFADLTGIVVDDPLLQNSLQGPTESKLTDGILVRGETWIYTGNYTVPLIDITSKGSGSGRIENTAAVTTDQFPPVYDSIETPILFAKLGGNVREDINVDEVGDVNIVAVSIKLLDKDGSVIATTLTNEKGEYLFENLQGGNYQIVEVNLPGYLDVKDIDGGDANLIQVKDLKGGDALMGNNFVDSRPGSLSGFVFLDKVDGSPISGVTVNLFNVNGTLVAASITENDGSYKFENLVPGNYVVQELNLSDDYEDVSDQDNTDDSDPLDTNVIVDNKIFVKVNPLEIDTRNDFVDRLKLGSISGNVTDNTNQSISGVLIELMNSTGSFVQSTLTMSDGSYKFSNLHFGEYTLKETNPKEYPIDISDYDQSNDGDSFDKNTTVDNFIQVKILPGEHDSDNNFRDSNQGKIQGTVKTDEGSPIPQVVITLKTQQDGLIKSTTMTDVSGAYSFQELEPGHYNVIETNLSLYPVDISDYDTIPDGDTSDGTKAVDNTISVTLAPGETDSGNDFVDSNKGSITGSVKDNKGIPLTGVLLELKNSTLAVIKTTITNGNGEYSFENVSPGVYTVTETNPPLYPANISDQDNSNDGDATDSNKDIDNVIGVTVEPGEVDSDNNFVDGQLGSISGSVRDDNTAPLATVLISLMRSGGEVVRTTLTGIDGLYIFEGVLPGSYTLLETNPVGYNTDISDQDNSSDGDAGDSNKTVDNIINVVLAPGEIDSDNDFVDSDNGSISGNVTDDQNNALSGVVITLERLNGDVVATTLTDSSGKYIFANTEPGAYIVLETNPSGYPSNVLDQDRTPDGDAGESSPLADNSIAVTLEKSEHDTGNDFVDSSISVTTFPSLSPTDIPSFLHTDFPSLKTSYSPSQFALPSHSPSFTPSMKDVETPSKVPSEFSSIFPSNFESLSPSYSPTVFSDIFKSPPLEEFCLSTSGMCDTCTPFRSQDYCTVEESFSLLIRNRTSAIRTNPTAVSKDGFWFHYLEDKVAAYLLSAELNVPAPQIFCCVESIEELRECLDTMQIRSEGLVIKATHFHSNQGVYILVPNPDKAVNGTINLLDKRPMSIIDVLTELSFMQASKIIVEEFIGSSLPIEYKFHVFNGEIGSVDIITGRSGECPCYAVVDKAWNRLDTFGCFEPSHVGNVEKDTNCTSIDFSIGRRKAGPVKKDLYICSDIPIVDECIKQEMIELAIEIGKRVGVYIRVDMFVADGRIFIQEYSTNHMNGLRHCAAYFDPKTGCVDSCFLGRMWNSAGTPYGGVKTVVPEKLEGFMNLNAKDQCRLLSDVQISSRKSQC